MPADLDLPAGEWRRIAIFMNVFDVHEWAPVAGKVTATSYHAGQFVNASLDKASGANERQNVVIEWMVVRSWDCPDCRACRTPDSGSGSWRQLAIGNLASSVWQSCDLWISLNARSCHAWPAHGCRGRYLQILVNASGASGLKESVMAAGEKQRRFRSVCSG